MLNRNIINMKGPEIGLKKGEKKILSEYYITFR